MADILAFPSRSEPIPAKCYRFEDVIGARSGISVRILSRIGKPHDLLVVLDGTLDGSTTIAALPATERAVADVIAYSTLATLEAAGQVWQGKAGVIGA